MSTLAKVLRGWADRLDGGQPQQPMTVVVNSTIDPKATAQLIRRTLLDLKRRNGGEELGLS